MTNNALAAPIGKGALRLVVAVLIVHVEKENFQILMYITLLALVRAQKMRNSANRMHGRKSSLGH